MAGYRPRRQPDAVTARQRQLEELHEELVQGVRRLANPGEWQTMLTSASTLRGFSYRNLEKIRKVCPHATQVASVEQWNKLGRRVRSGERAIWIKKPVRRDVAEYNPRIRRTETVTKVVGYQDHAVFDVSQTYGRPLPARGQTAARGYLPPAVALDRVLRLIQREGYLVVFRQPVNPTALGSTNPGLREVRIRPGGSTEESLATALHELSHIRRGHLASAAEYQRHKGVMEVEAESIAFIVAKAIGLDTKAYSFDYVDSWCDGDTDLIRRTADAVVDEAHSILDEISPQRSFDRGPAGLTDNTMGAEL